MEGKRETRGDRLQDLTIRQGAVERNNQDGRGGGYQIVEQLPQLVAQAPLVTALRSRHPAN